MVAMNEIIDGILKEMDIDADEISLRKGYLELSANDKALLKELHDQLNAARPYFIDDFYAHLAAFTPTRALIPDVPTLERLKQKQSEYFDRLTAGEYDWDYVRDRLRVGVAHQHVGLPPQWYLGAYSKYLINLLPEVWHITQGDADKTLAALRALIRIIFFDIGLAIDTYIHADRRAIESLKAFAENIVASLPLCLLVISAEHRIVSANLPCRTLFGLSADHLAGKHLEEILPKVGVQEAADEVLATGKARRGMTVKLSGGGEEKYLRISIARLDSAEKQPPEAAQLLLAVENLTEEERLRALTMDSAERVRSIMDNVIDGIITINEHGIVESFNRSAQRIFGHTADEVIGRNVSMLMPEPYHSEHDGYLARYLSSHQAACLNFGVREVLGRRKDGSTFPMNLATSEMRLGDRRLFIGIARDITEHKQDKERLDYLANFDELTGLPNRNLFQDRLSQRLTHAFRHDNQPVALLFLGLDRFKAINDTLGHDHGDLLLHAVAQRLKDCVRTEDTVARAGGDEFAIILTDVKGPQDAVRVAEKVLEAFRHPFLVREQELFISASIGIALYPSDGADTQTLLKNAGVAMDRAKEKGKNTYQFYTAGMNSQALARLTLENRLRRALERNEYLLHYQPMVDVASGKITSVEALIRWRHAQSGLVPPAEFIPLLEDTGLIVPVGAWVLRTACAQARFWQTINPCTIGVSVNLSARQFNDPRLAEQIGQILADTGLEPHLLELEITESMLMQNVETAIDTLNALHGMGVRLAIDDFGTGYSSLSYLRRFPIHSLKIDRSFVDGVTTNPDDAAIADAILALAHTLNLRVIAEGVETAEQLQYLRSRRCDMAQGYLLSKPLPAEEITRMLGEDKRL
ncbi:MAG: EAL domain-containing protein [Gammaproteobacteria bacterium]|nr:EAL domain-containing protein [Gammaproteobacteria bacterium]